VQVLEPLARFQAELGHEQSAHLAIGGQGVGAASGAQQGEHQQPVQVLAQSMRPDQLLQLGRDLVVAAEMQIGLDPGLERLCAQLGQPRACVPLQGAGWDVGQRLAAPQGGAHPQRPEHPELNDIPHGLTS
jgi:hypothetical protein